MEMLREERALRGRLGGLTTHARHDSHTITDAARAAFRQRFADEVDPDRVLSDTERDRRVDAAIKAYFARLALRSVQARRRRREETEQAARDALTDAVIWAEELEGIADGDL